MPARLGPPLLVLDFDGVISISDGALTAVQRLRRNAVERVDRIVRTTGAAVVASTTWRYDPTTNTGHKAPRLTEWLRMFGFTGEIAGITPHLPHGRRALEIQSYLDSLPLLPRALCILEDWEPMEHLTPWTVRTDYDRRLTETDAALAIALLKMRGAHARPARAPRRPAQGQATSVSTR